MLQRIALLPYWKEISALESLSGLPFYLVGGSVRDLLLERPVSDLDIVAGRQAVAAAREFAGVAQGAFVPLDWERETVRVVVDDNVFDFSAIKGNTIIEDLAKRDFTINAIAVKVDSQGRLSKELTDPFNGVRDLYARRLIPCSEGIFLADPLRILRAYRLTAAIGLLMSEGLVQLISRDRTGLTRTSPERIRDELFLILAHRQSNRTIKEMEAAGIISTLFPETDLMKKTAQDRYHHLDVWEHSLVALEKLEEIILDLPGFFDAYSPDVSTFLESSLVRGRPVKCLVKLAALFHDAGKPETRFVDEHGAAHFHGHEKAGGIMMKKMAKRLKLSRRETEFASRLVSGHMHPHHLLSVSSPSLKSLVRFFGRYADCFWGLFCIYYADLLAKQGPESEKSRLVKAHDCLMSLLSSYFREIRPRQIKMSILTGRDLIEELGLNPGPLFKEILKKTEEAYLEGRIEDKRGAIEFARRVSGPE
jgi:poly(A) polymerase